MLSRLNNLIANLMRSLPQLQLAPVPASGRSQQMQRALLILETRHDRGEISDAEYVRQSERLTGR